MTPPKLHNLQPINLLVVCEFEDELVNDAIDAYRPADEFQFCIGRVAKDEIVSVETRELSPPNASR